MPDPIKGLYKAEPSSMSLQLPLVASEIVAYERMIILCLVHIAWNVP